ncbi:low-specificity L-threonine aldolase [Ornithinibacillus sp. 4-3]|uniref:Low-specificity L-threonine aldolase n=1 Tax=Ornithinibacillus sp. 4-3 TaxID=3231488 RepID=A0AB39HMF2_9BACI
MIDLRSDTVTKPTPEMRQAAFDAVVGDDVYGEDPTLLELEELSANMLGKEAAMFVTSGTQGNQIAVLTQCVGGQEIIVEEESHLFFYEGAAMSVFAGVQPRTLKGNRGALNPAEVKAAIRGEDVHAPETGLICIENTHNRAGGAIIPLENMQAIAEIGKEYHIPIHLDGARIFNAAVASGVDVKKYAAQVDSVQFCLSKGLGAPVGSIIAGTNDFIQRARKWRKRLGGGLRQAGILAAPGLISLREKVDRLVEDHNHAKLLAQSINEIKGLSIENEVETNIVLVNTEAAKLTAAEFLAQLKQEGILAVPFGPNTVRFVTHFDVSRQNIEEVVVRLNRMMKILT